MNVLDFIKQDVKKQRERTKVSTCLLILALILMSLAFGFFIRDDFGAGLKWDSALSAIIGFAILVTIQTQILKSIYHQKLLLYLFGVCFLLSIQSAIFYPNQIYPSTEQFYLEAAKCFMVGSLSTLLVGLTLIFFTFKYSSWPNRLSRFLLSASAGLSGSFMLEIHCDSTSLSHVLSGHILQGLISGLLIFCLIEYIFVKKVRSSFPELKLKKTNHL
jgi:hypothetical protein